MIEAERVVVEAIRVVQELAEASLYSTVQEVSLRPGAHAMSICEPVVLVTDTDGGTHICEVSHFTRKLILLRLLYVVMDDSEEGSILLEL